MYTETDCLELISNSDAEYESPKNKNPLPKTNYEEYTKEDTQKLTNPKEVESVSTKKTSKNPLPVSELDYSETFALISNIYDPRNFGSVKKIVRASL